MKSFRIPTFLFAIFVLLCILSFGQAPLAQAQSWPQWGQNPQHQGFLNVAGQSLNNTLADVVYDPFVSQEQAATGGDLLVHYQVPLLDGNDVFMEFKTGQFTGLNTWETQIWNQRKLHWQGSQLVTDWNFQSDWKPVPRGGPVSWEPVYHAVLVGNFIYDPGFGGTIFKLNRSDGSVVARINPFGPDIDRNIFVAGPLSADSSGNVYYNAIKLHATDPWGKDVIESWLVKVAPNDVTTTATFTSLTPGAPAGSDQCLATFSNSQLPWPPSPTAVPPSITCGSQRPGINVAPAVAPDGTIYTISRAHFISRRGFLVAVNPNLTPKWIASLRDRFNDGCGVPVSAGGTLPPNGTPGGCRAGANLGVDPATNGPGGGRVLDDSTSSPTVAPDGSIFYGAYSRYNYAQGHLMHFSSTGAYLGAYNFGWDSTPAIFQQGGTYSVVIKDNHYSGLGSYCNNPTICPPDRTATNPASPEAFFVTQLSPNLSVEWKFQNTNTLSCTRNPDGTVSCVSDHPNSFVWCINAPAIDANGVVYGNSEDGNLFAINQGGTLKQKIFQQLALGASYTPVSISADGKIYSQNAGHLFVVGN